MRKKILALITLSIFMLLNLPPQTLTAEFENEPPPKQKQQNRIIRPSIDGEATEIEILIYVIDVDEVDSADQTFAASVFYRARWKDPSLAHPGPESIQERTIDVWTPQLIIVNKQMSWKSFPEFVEISPDGTVNYRQQLWGKFSQPFKLHEFPLDKQTLSIQIVSVGLSEERVNIVPLILDNDLSSSIASEFSLPDFKVISWEAKPQPYFPFKDEVAIPGFEMKLTVKRLSGYYVFKTIIPLCLIIMMSWLPRWIDPKQIGANIGISTTAFLTLVAYLFAITVLLPKVSYITRMDRFILLSTFVVFLGMIQTVVSTVLVKNNKLKLAQNLDLWGRLIYPVILGVILYGSFIY